MAGCCVGNRPSVHVERSGARWYSDILLWGLAPIAKKHTTNI